jgi:endonuclease YncB( thermonuclease family)
MNRLFSLPILLLFALLLVGCSLGQAGVSLSQTRAQATGEGTMGGEAAEVRFAASLYAGPATIYEDRGSAFPGQSITVTGRDESGEWYQLGNGSWIVGFAVDLDPEQEATLPVVTEITGRMMGRVAAVRDGDTLEVVVGPDRFPVRLIMVIAPPLNLPAGEAARAYQQQLLLGQQVLLESDTQEKDAFGRSLRYVYLRQPGGGDLLVNQAILESGLAQLAIFPPNLRHLQPLAQAQSTAQAQDIGLWAGEALPFDADGESCRYTMLPGDSLLAVARLFGVSLIDLATLNEIQNPNLIRDGTELRIPGCQGAGGADAP